MHTGEGQHKVLLTYSNTGNYAKFLHDETLSANNISYKLHICVFYYQNRIYRRNMRNTQDDFDELTSKADGITKRNLICARLYNMNDDDSDDTDDINDTNSSQSNSDTD